MTNDKTLDLVDITPWLYLCWSLCGMATVSGALSCQQ